jgi:hypothetical protein
MTNTTAKTKKQKTRTRKKAHQLKMSNTNTIKNLKTGGELVFSRSVSGSCFI